MHGGLFGRESLAIVFVLLHIKLHLGTPLRFTVMQSAPPRHAPHLVGEIHHQDCRTNAGPISPLNKHIRQHARNATVAFNWESIEYLEATLKTPVLILQLDESWVRPCGAWA